MKKVYSLLVSSVCFALQATAQLGEGGTPPSFRSDPENTRVTFITTPSFNIDSMLSEDVLRDANKQPYRFGYNHFVNYNLQNSGTWETASNGTRTWRLGITCPGAMTVNLAFDHFKMAPGAKLFVYSADHQAVAGAFTEKHNWADEKFGTELLPGESVIVEVVEPAAVAGQSTLNLFRITHGYRSTSPFIQQMLRGFGDAGNCHNNVHCPGAANWQDQVRAAVCLVSGGSEFCSGSLINNTCNNGTPYVLTANHCGSADGTWVFRMNWEAPGCSDPTSSPASQSLSGGTARASWAGSDVHLAEINSAIPSNYNVFFAGWNRVNTPADSTVCIHHPAGDIKKISWAQNPTISATYGSADCWRTTLWTSGVTEPGSSGSPLYDQNRRIVGQLYGGPSYCGAPTNSLNDYYGKFSTSWTGGGTNSTRLSNWLDACNTGATTDDGYDPNQPTVALDAQMLGIVTPASGTISTCNTTYSFTPVVTLRNAGTNTLTSATITYQLDTQTPVVYNWTGSLATGANTNLTLNAMSAGSGAHTFQVTVSNPNNGTDGNASNNTASVSFTVNVMGPVPLPIVEGFEQTTFAPAGWMLNNPNNNNTWERTTAASGYSSSTASARIDHHAPQSSTAGNRDNLYTPVLDLTGATNASLLFDVAYARYSATYSDTLAVLVSTDCGQTWSTIFVKGGTTLATAPDNTNAFIPNASQWRTENVSLNSYLGQNDVQLNFQLRSGWGNICYLDNVNITSSTAVGPEWHEGLVSIYPNPVNNATAGAALTIDFGSRVITGCGVTITDMAGRRVLQQQFAQVEGKTVLHTGELQAGVYMLQLSHNGQQFTKKLVIQH